MEEIGNKPWKFSSYFKLYGREGLQVSFTVNGDDGAEHMAQMGDYITTLLSEEGFTITPEGIKPGEKLQEVDGWVYGETSEGKPCIHLFKSPLQWKVATIYEERIKDVPIKIDPKQQVWPGQAPEREMAERRQMLNPCNFTIVLLPSGKTTERGNPVMKFDRTIGHGGSAREAKGKTNSPDSYADLVKLLSGEAKSLAEWCRGRQTTEKNIASLAQVQALTEEIDNITGDKGTGEIVLEVLTGVPAPEIAGKIKSYITNGLTDWIAPYTQEGKNTVENAKRRPAVVEAVKTVWQIVDGYIAAHNAAGDNPPPMSYQGSAGGNGGGNGGGKQQATWSGNKRPDLEQNYSDADIPF